MAKSTSKLELRDGVLNNSFTNKTKNNLGKRGMRAHILLDKENGESIYYLCTNTDRLCIEFSGLWIVTALHKHICINDDAAEYPRLIKLTKPYISKGL